MECLQFRSEVTRLKEKVLNMLEKSREEIEEGLLGDMSSIVQESLKMYIPFFMKELFVRCSGMSKLKIHEICFSTV